MLWEPNLLVTDKLTKAELIRYANEEVAKLVREKIENLIVLNAVRTWPGGVGEFAPWIVAKIREGRV